MCGRGVCVVRDMHGRGHTCQGGMRGGGGGLHDKGGMCGRRGGMSGRGVHGGGRAWQGGMCGGGCTTDTTRYG